MRGLDEARRRGASVQRSRPEVERVRSIYLSIYAKGKKDIEACCSYRRFHDRVDLQATKKWQHPGLPKSLTGVVHGKCKRAQLWAWQDAMRTVGKKQILRRQREKQKGKRKRKRKRRKEKRKRERKKKKHKHQKNQGNKKDRKKARKTGKKGKKLGIHVFTKFERKNVLL